MPDPDGLAPIFGVVLAYGPAPGVELIPYFLGLLAWAGLAVSAFLLAPLMALLRRLRGTRGPVGPEPADDPQLQESEIRSSKSETNPKSQ